ncbi:MAG: outer membrane protein beta-barrel domain [Gemmatimonadetes bacterium]|jgi:hypothetical protein|nr:outer membrane protein beta-barrel domain [Gemmatimonadota bacterium]
MRRILSIASLAVLALSTTASAQRGRASSPSPSSGASPVELGLDAGITIGTGGTNNGTSFNFPVQSVRAGFMFTPAWSIEPSLGLSRNSNDNGSLTTYSVGVGALYHFSPVRTASQVYVRPFVNLIGFSSKDIVSSTTTVTTSDNMTELGVGLGVKLPWQDRLAWRLEANLSHLSEKVASGDTRIGLLAGVSYFTH